MTEIVSPRFGLAKHTETGKTGDPAKQAAKITTTATDAARRKFTPEFMNRIDKVVVFKPLGRAELERIIEIELDAVRTRVAGSTLSGNRPLQIEVTDRAKHHLLMKGSDSRYGARPLKRALDRFLVQPLANLIATRQVNGGDMVSVDHREGENLSFIKFDPNAEPKPPEKKYRAAPFSASEFLTEMGPI
jgi:ATP-dependent Clp protease ATP-binding subunit ClpA